MIERMTHMVKTVIILAVVVMIGATLLGQKNEIARKRKQIEHKAELLGSDFKFEK